MIIFVVGLPITIKTMSNIYENVETVECPTLYAPGGFGYFAVKAQSETDYNSVYWDKCREQFAKKFTSSLEGFFFSTYDKFKHGVPLFVRDTEDFLQTNNKSKFYITTRENAVYIEISDFWKKCYMRRSLYSLICRLGLCYDGHSWEKTLLGDMPNTSNQDIDANFLMARKTQKAIMRFFMGFTKYIGNLSHLEKEYFPEKHGWVIEFANKTNEQIKQVLVLEDMSKCVLSGNYIFGKELLLK